MRVRASIVVLSCLVSVAAAAAEPVFVVADPPVASPGQPVELRLVRGAGAGGGLEPEARADGARFQRIWRSGRQSFAPGSTETYRADEVGTQLVVYSDDAAGRFAKVLVVAGEPAPGGQLHLSEVGQRLELVPQTDPVVLLRGGTAFELQVLFQREPLAGAVIEAWPADDPGGGGVRARTDEIGLATLGLRGAGRWFVHVRHGDAVSTIVLWRRDEP